MRIADLRIVRCNSPLSTHSCQWQVLRQDKVDPLKADVPVRGERRVPPLNAGQVAVLCVALQQSLPSQILADALRQFDPQHAAS